MAIDLYRTVHFVRKTALNIGIFVLIVLPKPIYRQPLLLNNDGQENVTDLTVFHFRPYHLFCLLSNHDPTMHVGTVDQAMILQALHLPNGSLVSKSLEKLGRCLAVKSMTNRQSLDDVCGCQPRPAYLILIIACLLWQLIDYVRFYALPRDVYRSNEQTFLFFDAVGWLVVVSLAFTFHTLWFDDVWLPTEIYSKPYFQRPLQWTLAIYFALVCWISYLFDFVLKNYFYKKRRIIADSVVEVIEEKEESEIQPKIVQPPSVIEIGVAKEATDSTEKEIWSVVPYSDDVIERMTNWRVVHTVIWNKTWP